MKFRMAQASYIDNKLYSEDTILDLKADEHKVHNHTPGPHWEPLDDEAKALCKDRNIAFTGFVPDSIDAMTRELDATRERDKIAGSPSAIGAAVVAALQDAEVIPRAKGKKATAPAEI